MYRKEDREAMGNVVFPTRQDWANALRSGDYVQGKSSLRNRDNNLGVNEHCCLGVYADLFIKANPDSQAHWDSNEDCTVDRFIDAAGGIHIGILATEMVEEMGLSLNEQQALVDMNDEYEVSFSEIAEYVGSGEYIESPRDTGRIKEIIANA